MLSKPPDIKTIYNHLKASAKKRNIPFDLTLTQLNNFTFFFVCPILNIPIRYNHGKLQDDSISIDRIDSTKGYTIDNIICVSWKANRAKSNLTKEELKAIADFYN